MKKGRKLMSAVSAMALIVCMVPVSANAASIDVVPHEAVSVEASKYAYFTSVESAGNYVREQMKLHNPELHIRLSFIAGSQDILNDVLSAAFAETGKGDEGDYLRLSISGYRSSTNRILYDPVLDILFYYNSTIEEDEAVTEKINSILDSLELDGKDEYEKITAVYDYLVTHVDYSENLERDEIFTSYGALVEGSAVCQGYIQSIYRMLTDSGVTCRAVMGEGNGGDHVWCIAGIDDTYYLLDPTWDSEFKGIIKPFFLRGSEDFDKYSYPTVHIAGTGDPDNYAFVPDCTAESFAAAYPISKSAFDPESYYSRFLAGDINYDGCVDIFDLISAKQCLISGKIGKRTQNAADVNGDGTVNISDAVLIQKFVQGIVSDFSIAS